MFRKKQTKKQKRKKNKKSRKNVHIGGGVFKPAATATPPVSTPFVALPAPPVSTPAPTLPPPDADTPPATPVPTLPPPDADTPPPAPDDTVPISTSIIVKPQPKKPVFELPYTYYILKTDDFSRKDLNMLNEYLNIQTFECEIISYGDTIVSIDEQNPIKTEYSDKDFKKPFLNEGEICVLVMPIDQIWEIQQNPTLLFCSEFFNKHILGHAKLFDFTDIKKMGIFNVCLHSLDITFNIGSDNKIEKKQNLTGYGSVLFKAILNSAEDYIKKTYITDIENYSICLDIDTKNVAFEKVSWLYTSYGFTNHRYTNKYPNGSASGSLLIELSKPPLKYVNSRIDAMWDFYETIDLRRQIQDTACFGLQGLFNMRFNFDKSSILSMHLMPFLSFDQTKISEPLTGLPQPPESTQQVIASIDSDIDKYREISGNFIPYNIEKIGISNKTDILHTLSLDVRDDTQPKCEIGTAFNVQVDFSKLCGYHTHPTTGYIKYGIIICSPSSLDLNVLFHTSKTQFIQFGCTHYFDMVISMEGIYFYSLTIQALEKIMRGEDLTFDNVWKHYEYPLANRKYDWSNYLSKIAKRSCVPQPRELDHDIVMIEVKKYLKWFKTQLETRKENYISMRFVSWKDFDSSTEFRSMYCDLRLIDKDLLIPVDPSKIPGPDVRFLDTPIDKI